MWEDGFCRPRVAECLEDIDGEDPVRKAFIKMSIQLYNYGEGWVLGKVQCRQSSFVRVRAVRLVRFLISSPNYSPPLAWLWLLASTLVGSTTTTTTTKSIAS